MTTNPLLETLSPLVADLSRELDDGERDRRLLAAVRRLFPCDAVARLKFDGELLLPVAVEGPLPVRGTAVTDAAGAEVGEMRSGRDGLGLAMLRLEALERGPFGCGEAVLAPRILPWMRLPAREEA